MILGGEPSFIPDKNERQRLSSKEERLMIMNNITPNKGLDFLNLYTSLLEAKEVLDKR